jgi:hypothetical protein
MMRGFLPSDIALDRQGLKDEAVLVKKIHVG